MPLCLPVHKPQRRATPSPTVPSPEALTYAHTIHQLFSVFVNESTFYELEQTMPPCGLTSLPFPGCEPPQHPNWGDSGGERSCWTLPLGYGYPLEEVSGRLSAEMRDSVRETAAAEGGGEGYLFLHSFRKGLANLIGLESSAADTQAECSPLVIRGAGTAE